MIFRLEGKMKNVWKTCNLEEFTITYQVAVQIFWSGDQYMQLTLGLKNANYFSRNVQKKKLFASVFEEIDGKTY